MTRRLSKVAPNFVAVNCTRGRVPTANAAAPPGVVTTSRPESATPTVPSAPSGAAVKGRWGLRAAMSWLAVVWLSAIATVSRFAVAS